MWKYRNRGILGEWNCTAVVIACFVLLAAGFVIVVLEQQDPETTLSVAVYALPLVLAAAVILVRAFFFRREKHADAEYLAKAVRPDWRRLPQDSEIIPKMQEICKSHIIASAVLLAVLLPCLILAMVSQQFAREATWLCLIVLLVLVIWVVRNVLRRLFWLHPPIELEYTVIDVAYCTETKYYVKSGTRKDMSLFFFLPSGRYRVVLHSQRMSSQPPERVYFVRLHGIVHWIHWED